MASNSELDKRFCVVWETKLTMVWHSSRLFSLLDYTWYLTVTSDGTRSGSRILIRLNNQTDRDFATNGFGVTTFIEKIMPPTPVLSFKFTPIPSLRKHSSIVIWNRSRSEILRHFTQVPDSEFRIVCLFHGVPSTTIQSKKETITSDKCVQATMHLSPDLESLSLDLCNLLDNKALPDMKLRCGDRSISVHKAVLAARSEVFAAMFQTEMLESETGVVDIIDVDAPVLELFLKYVYSGKMSDVSDDIVPSLYAAGDKYAVHSLKKACSERMIAGLSEENYLCFLTTADQHSDEDLKNAAINFILEHREVLKSQDWSRFKTKHSTLATNVMTIIVDKVFN